VVFVIVLELFGTLPKLLVSSLGGFIRSYLVVKVVRQPIRRIYQELFGSKSYKEALKKDFLGVLW